MTSGTIKQMPGFKKAYKLFHNVQRQKVNDAIRAIVADPGLGEEKKGDLAGVFVYKFKMHNQDMLLAYEWYQSDRLLLAIGSHQNFYRDLKKRR